MIRVASLKEKRFIIKHYPHTAQFIKRKGTLYISVDERRISGFAFVQKRNLVNEKHLKEALILVIEVFKLEDRQRGIASQLVEQVKKDAAEQGCYQVIAFYQQSNTASHKLWLRNQFGVMSITQPDGSVSGCCAICKL